MNTNSFFSFIIAFLIMFFTSLSLAFEAVTMPVSVSDSGEFATGFGVSSMSADGRFITFISMDYILLESFDHRSEIFVRDQLNKTTTLVRNNLTEGIRKSVHSPSISADGRYIVYRSIFTFPEKDSKGGLFVYDRLSGFSEQVCEKTPWAGNPEYYHMCWQPSISADGRYIAYSSDSPGLIDNDNNGTQDVFVYDRVNGMTERVSINSMGEQGNAESLNPKISADGQYIAFNSYATNLVSNDTNKSIDIFLHDRDTGITSVVSRNSAGKVGSISADGRYIVFNSSAANLVDNDTNGKQDVFVYDRINGTTELVSKSSSGEHANISSFSGSISANGRYVTFDTEACEMTYVPGGYSYCDPDKELISLVSDDTNFAWDVFVHDRVNGTTERVSVNSSGKEGNKDSQLSFISADGNFITFDSHATNMINEDKNYIIGVFVRGPLHPLIPIDTYHTSFETTSWPERWYSYGWSLDETTRSEGNYSLKANQTADNETAVTEWRVNIANAGTMSFDLKVDSEQSHDFFRLYIDDELHLERSGFVDWSEYYYPLSAGEHRLRFEYHKDSSSYSGADTAWIDNVQFLSGSPIETHQEIQNTLIERLGAKMPYVNFDDATVSYQKEASYFSSPMEIVLGFIHSDAFQTQEINELSDSDIDDLADLIYLIYVGSAAGPTELDFWSTQLLIREFDMQEFLQRQKFSDLTD